MLLLLRLLQNSPRRHIVMLLLCLVKIDRCLVRILGHYAFLTRPLVHSVMDLLREQRLLLVNRVFSFTLKLLFRRGRR